jgi:hypothetical protein
MTWSLEWRIALAQRRLFAFNVLVPLLLVAPVALGGAPPQHAALVYTLLVTFFGIFGSAIPLARDAQSGLIERCALSGIPPRRWTVERSLASAGLDTLQLAPALLLVAISAGAGALATLLLLATASCALVAGNAIGSAVAAGARSIAEAALFSTVIALLLAHTAGVFRAPPAGLAATLQSWVPFAYLHDAVRAALLLRPLSLATMPAAALTAAAALFVVTAAAPALLRRLAAAPRRI